MLEIFSPKTRRHLKALRKLLSEPSKIKKSTKKEILAKLTVLEKELWKVDADLKEVKILVTSCRQMYQELDSEKSETEEEETIRIQGVTFYEKLESWLRQEIRQKMQTIGKEYDEDMVEQIAISMIVNVKYRQDSKHLDKYSKKERPTLNLTLDDIKKHCLFSVGLEQIVWKLVIDYELKIEKEKMDFEQHLEYWYKLYKDLI